MKVNLKDRLAKPRIWQYRESAKQRYTDLMIPVNGILSRGSKRRRQRIPPICAQCSLLSRKVTIACRDEGKRLDNNLQRHMTCVKQTPTDKLTLKDQSRWIELSPEFKVMERRELWLICENIQPGSTAKVLLYLVAVELQTSRARKRF